MTDPTEVKIEDVLAELDELGRAKWDLACARVEARKLREELARRTNTPPDEHSEPQGPRQVAG